jgi:hypothetical protein
LCSKRQGRKCIFEPTITALFVQEDPETLEDRNEYMDSEALKKINCAPA